jgi:hypothetical protein
MADDAPTVVRNFGHPIRASILRRLIAADGHHANGLVIFWEEGDDEAIYLASGGNCWWVREVIEG